MADFIEIDFLGVETAKSGDAITIRYSTGGATTIHVVDGGFIDTGEQIVDHLLKTYGTKTIDHVVLTHPDRDHANGLRAVLEKCTVKNLWINRPWIYAEELIHRFETYNSVEALRRKLRDAYDATAILEDLALETGVSIRAPLQGERIGMFDVLAPSKSRYLDLIVSSVKTPQPVEERALSLERLSRVLKAAAGLVRAAWGEEYFPPEPTSRENEMSVVQTALFEGRRVLLTGDAGREALAEAIARAPSVGLKLPGITWFQVPHHGGRHNVSTAILDALLGKRLPAVPPTTSWSAICSSALADEDHPRKSVIRAIMHRGGMWTATEGRMICWSANSSRTYSALAQANYPEEQES